MQLDEKTFLDRFASALESSEALIEGEGQYGAEKFSELKALMHDALGVPPDAAHAFKLRSNSVDNCLWEGAPLSKRFQLGLAMVPSAVAEDKPGNVSGFPTAVEHRMFPGPNGFEAIAICSRGVDGNWRVSDIVSERSSEIASKLHSLFPEASLHEARQVAPRHRSYEAGSHVRATQTAALIEAITEHLLEAKNVILQGPPGTGKTFLCAQVVARLAGGLSDFELEAVRFGNLVTGVSGGVGTLLVAPSLGDVVWEQVQLHPSFSYDDFVRGTSAVQDGSAMRFVSEDRLLVQFALLARAHPDTSFVLLLDEINRCNLSSLLGELIFAIEPGARGLAVRLQYAAPAGGWSGDALAIPPNLYFIGTMNTADRSIGLVDYAIRRRFRFLDIRPSVSALLEHYEMNPAASAAAVDLFKEINYGISDPNLHIGQSCFLVSPDASNWAELLLERIFYEVVPMLREYFSEGRAIDRPTISLSGTVIHLRAVGRAFDESARQQILAKLTGSGSDAI